MKRMNSTVSAGTCKQHTGTRTIGCTVRQKKKKRQWHMTCTMLQDPAGAWPLQVTVFSPVIISSSRAARTIKVGSPSSCWPECSCVACVCCVPWLLLCSDDEHWLLGMTKRWPPPPAAGLLSPFGAELLVRRLLLWKQPSVPFLASSHSVRKEPTSFPCYCSSKTSTTKFLRSGTRININK